jgi:hypothetical protein
MFARRISILLFSVALVAVSVFAVRTLPLLVAKGTEWGELCRPGNAVEKDSDAVASPNPATSPPSFTVSWTNSTTLTDGACEDDDLPPDYKCSTCDSDPDANPATVSFDMSQVFTKQPDGNYKPEPINVGPLKKGGDTYVRCADDMGGSW